MNDKLLIRYIPCASVPEHRVPDASGIGGSVHPDHRLGDRAGMLRIDEVVTMRLFT